MKYLILSFILVFSYLDASGVVLKKRKNKIENRFSQIGSVYRGLPSPEADADYKKLEEDLKKLDDSFQTGEKEKRGTLLTDCRLTLVKLEKDYSKFLDNEAKEVIALYATSSREKLRVPPSSQKKLTPETRDKIEKANRSQNYFRMAKRERSIGAKYTTNRNYYYSIHQFKRSIIYSVRAMKEAGVDVPEKYAKAVAEWTGKKPEEGASSDAQPSDSSPTPDSSTK